jgi:integrase
MPRTPGVWYRASRRQWCTKIDGKVYPLATAEEGESAAKRALPRLLKRLGAAPPDSALSVSDVLNEFLDHCHALVERGERRQVTFDGYLRHLKSFSVSHGRRKALDATPGAVEAWAGAKPGWGPTTRHNAITAVLAAFRWAYRTRLIPSNPLDGTRKPSPRKRTAFLTEEQIAVVLEHASPALREFLEFLQETGARPGEVAGMKLADINTDDGYATVANQSRQQGMEFRNLALSEHAKKISRLAPGQHDIDGSKHAFLNGRGRPWTRHALACAFARIRRRTGFGPECTAYAFRHAFAVSALRRGVSATDLAAQLGHKDTRMIERVYGHLDQQHEAMRRALRPTAEPSPTMGQGVEQGGPTSEPDIPPRPPG